MAFLNLLKLNIPVVKQAFKSAGIHGSPYWSSQLSPPQTVVRDAALRVRPTPLQSQISPLQAYSTLPGYHRSLMLGSEPTFSTITATQPPPTQGWASYARARLQSAQDTILNYLDDFRMWLPMYCLPLYNCSSPTKVWNSSYFELNTVSIWTVLTSNIN